jgi:formylglycine-generating enzyme required for sulfatase activity
LSAIVDNFAYLSPQIDWLLKMLSSGGACLDPGGREVQPVGDYRRRFAFEYIDAEMMLDSARDRVMTHLGYDPTLALIDLIECPRRRGPVSALRRLKDKGNAEQIRLLIDLLPEASSQRREAEGRIKKPEATSAPLPPAGPAADEAAWSILGDNELSKDQRNCRTVQQARDTSSDPGYLLAVAQENRCPELRDGVLSRAWSILKDKGNAEQIRLLIDLLPAASSLRREAEERIRTPGPVPKDVVAVVEEPGKTVIMPNTALTPEQERGLKPKDIFKECADCPEMVVVPAGSFTMGSQHERGRLDNEDPQHVVTFAKPFAVGKLHVTVDQFAAFVRETGYDTGRGPCSWKRPSFAQESSHPVVCVRWDDANVYVNWLANKTGKPYRLLTEAEWEYAARGRTSPGTYPRFWFGDDEKDLCQYGNFYDLKAGDTLSCDDGYAHTSPAGYYKPNAFGLYDMFGNAWQLTADHSARGGSWGNFPADLRVARRENFGDAATNSLGFRVARTLTP